MTTSLKGIFLPGRFLVVTLSAILSAPATAQTAHDGTLLQQVYPQGAPVWLAEVVQDPDDPAVRAYIEQEHRRQIAEQKLKKLRAQHFGAMRRTDIRQDGLLKLRSFADDPALFPSLLRIFRNEQDDVRLAILDIFTDFGDSHDGDEGDVLLAWVSVFDADGAMRVEARRRLLERTQRSSGAITNRVKLVIDQGLRSEVETPVVAASQLVKTLGLLDAIPLLISAQVSASDTGGGQRGDAAWIMIGTQEAFVSDVNPIVGTNSVAFDPQLSVITTGVVLRVIDGMAIIYRTQVHTTLIEMTSQAWGQSTQHMGWDVPRWKKWYSQEFLPFLAAQQARSGHEE